jgi:hypothetical protein
MLLKSSPLKTRVQALGYAHSVRKDQGMGVSLRNDVCSFQVEESDQSVLFVLATFPIFAEK